MIKFIHRNLKMIKIKIVSFCKGTSKTIFEGTLQGSVFMSLSFLYNYLNRQKIVNSIINLKEKLVRIRP